MTVIDRMHDDKAFTLIELIVSMALAMIVLSSLFTVCLTQQQQHHRQKLMIETQQNLRGAITVVEQQIRAAGYDPNDSGQFGIVDVRRYDLINTRPNRNGKPAIIFTHDLNENGSYDAGGEKVVFCIRKDLKAGRSYLAWNLGSGRFPLAENIVEIAFAYAVDTNMDGDPDKWPGTESQLWLVDSDNDNFLDTHLDVNCDGFIDEKDDTNGDNKISPEDGGALPEPVVLDSIRAVRIWFLAATRQPVKGHIDTQIYTIGDRIVREPKDDVYRYLSESIVSCRNL